MIAIDKVEDALIAAIKLQQPTLKTVQTLERDFTPEELDKTLVLAPFLLVRYDGLDPLESEREATGGSGMKQQDFILYAGSLSRRSAREGQVGCYTILDGLRTLLDGKNLMVEGEPITFALTAEAYVFTYKGLITYQAVYSIFED